MNTLKQKIQKLILKDEYDDDYVLTEEDENKIANTVKQWLTQKRQDWTTNPVPPNDQEYALITEIFDELLKELE